MENASKALLIAGSILLAIMILSIGIILYNNYSETSEQYEKRLSTIELNQYNSNFEVFAGRTDITAQDIVTLANFVNNNNKNKSYPEVDILVPAGYPSPKENGIDFLNECLKRNKKYFTCDNISYYSKTGLVKKIVFSVSTNSTYY